MIVLRPARSTDAGKVGAILTGFVAATDWMPHLHTGAEDVAHAGRLIDHGWVTIAERAGQVIGFVACDAGEVDALFVTQEARYQGAGSALLQHVMDQNDMLTLWTIQANAPAQMFYHKHGFVEVARTDGARNDERLPDIQMRWQRKVT